jgi:Cupin domain.
MRFGALMLLLALAGCRASQGDARSLHDTAASTGVAPDTTSAPITGGKDIDIYSADQLSKVAAEIAHGTSTASVLARRPDRYYVEARRVASGVPEVHDDFSDVTFVQSGRATLHTGTVRGAHLESRGEHRGGTIDDGVRRGIAAGDFFVIPAGTPHQFELATGDSIRYLTVKVRKPE